MDTNISRLPTFDKHRTWKFRLRRYSKTKFDHELNLINPLTGISYNWLVQLGANLTSRKAIRLADSKVTQGNTISVDVTSMSPSRIQLNAHFKNGTVEYVLFQAGSLDWMLTKRRSLNTNISTKEDYDNIKASKIDFSDKSQLMLPYIDGVSAVIVIGKPNRIYGEPNGREYSHKLLKVMNAKTLEEHYDTVLSCKIYGYSSKDGKPLTQKHIANVLSIDTLKSRRLQGESGLLRMALYDVIQDKDKGKTYSDRLTTIKAINKTLPLTIVPEIATSLPQKQRLFSSVSAGKHRDSSVGIILVNKYNDRIKPITTVAKGPTRGKKLSKKERFILSRSPKAMKKMAYDRTLYHYILSLKDKDKTFDDSIDIAKRVLKSGSLKPIEKLNPKRAGNYQDGLSAINFLRKNIITPENQKKIGIKPKNFGVYTTPIKWRGPEVNFKFKTSEMPSDSALIYKMPGTNNQIVDRLSEKALAKSRRIWTKSLVNKELAKDTRKFDALPQVVSFKDLPVTNKNIGVRTDLPNNLTPKRVRGMINKTASQDMLQMSIEANMHKDLLSGRELQIIRSYNYMVMPRQVYIATHMNSPQALCEVQINNVEMLTVQQARQRNLNRPGLSYPCKVITIQKTDTPIDIEPLLIKTAGQSIESAIKTIKPASFILDNRPTFSSIMGEIDKPLGINLAKGMKN